MAVSVPADPVATMEEEIVECASSPCALAEFADWARPQPPQPNVRCTHTPANDASANTATATFDH